MNKSDIPIINRLKLTRIKLFFAAVIYKLLKLFHFPDKLQIKRNGINYSINLQEGIDLSLFLFGHFQYHVVHPKNYSPPEDAIIIDIGANIGTFALPIAKLASVNKVYAIEPTEYAYNKLITNIDLNSDLKSKIKPIKRFLNDGNREVEEYEAYSSWNIAKRITDKHPVHGGIKQEVLVDSITTLDELLKELGVKKVDFIKIDTDGHEFNILKGAEYIITTYRPYILFEIGMYVLIERKQEFKYFLEFFNFHRYSLCNSKNGKQINLDNYLKRIPLNSTIDVLASPVEN